MFRQLIKQFRKMVTLYTWLCVLCAAASALSVVCFQWMVDLLTAGRDAGALAPPLAGYGVLWLAVLLLNYLEEYPHNQLRHGLYHAIKRKALEKVSRIDYTGYQDIGTGTLVQVVENGAAAGRDILFDFYLHIAAKLLPEAALSIALIGVYDIRIMAAALSGYAVVFLITRLLLKRLYDIKEKTLVSEEWLSRAYVRAFMEMAVFRVNRRFSAEGRRAAEAGRQVTDAHTRIKMVHELFFASFAILVLGIQVILIAVSAGHVFAGRMSVGVLLALLTLTDRIYQPIAVLNVIYVDYRLNRIAWSRFDAFLRAPDDPNLSGGKPFQPGGGALALEGVSFAYGGAPVLADVSLHIPAGSYTALVGRSGGGKSTLAKLMMGLLKPTKGHVLADGQDLREINLNSYYAHIAYLSQDTPVFDGTLRENICFDRAASDDSLREVIEAAALADCTAALAHGLDTQVGERGVKLSGGEKQRLAFARVFFQRPAVVILDEPTSALDHDTERRVLEAMRTRLKGTTVISIAHRLSTVRFADDIVVLEAGRVAEMGAHDALMERNGVYAALVRAGEDASAASDGEEVTRRPFSAPGCS